MKTQNKTKFIAFKKRSLRSVLHFLGGAKGLSIVSLFGKVDFFSLVVIPPKVPQVLSKVLFQADSPDCAS